MSRPQPSLTHSTDICCFLSELGSAGEEKLSQSYHPLHSGHWRPLPGLRGPLPPILNRPEGFAAGVVGQRGKCEGGGEGWDFITHQRSERGNCPINWSSWASTVLSLICKMGPGVEPQCRAAHRVSASGLSPTAILISVRRDDPHYLPVLRPCLCPSRSSLPCTLTSSVSHTCSCFLQVLQAAHSITSTPPPVTP